MDDGQQELVFARDLPVFGNTRRTHARAAVAGLENRVAHGVYVPQRTVARLDDRHRYLLRVRAVAETRRNRPVLSHWSAAAIHGLPMIGPWPASVHITQRVGNGSRSYGNVVRHSVILEDQDVVEIDGLLLTSVARTVIDLAASESTMGAVVVVDAAFHVDRFTQTPALVTSQELLEQWERKLPFRGHARSLEIIRFGESGADTPIESVSRVTMRIIDCPPPVLQLRHFEDDGLIGDTDFAWPDHGAIGEADGERKCLDEAFRSGRSVQQVVLDEKYREDRLRALPRTVAGWNWSTAMDPKALAHRLRAAGVPTGGRRG
jgi:hypothetical protein